MNKLQHFFDELNLLNWIVVIVCIITVNFVSEGNREFIRNIALTALPTTSLSKGVKAKDNDR
jgi:hypothetical protein